MKQKKKIFQCIMTIAFMALACSVAGCTEDGLLPDHQPESEAGQNTENGIPLQFSVSIADDATTRALTEKTSFSNGEEIGIYIYKKNSTTSLNSNLKATVSSGKLSFSTTLIITEDVDIKAYYPYRSGGDYTTMPTSGSFPYMATATASTSNANVSLKFTKNIAKVTITLINCPKTFSGGTVFGKTVTSEEMQGYSKNMGGWMVFKVTKYLMAGKYSGIIYANGTKQTKSRTNKELKAGTEYTYNYNFRDGEENWILIESEDDFANKVTGSNRKYTQIVPLSNIAKRDLSNCSYNGNGFQIEYYGHFGPAFSDLINANLKNMYFINTASTDLASYAYPLATNIEGGTISGCKRADMYIKHNYDTANGSNAGLSQNIKNVAITATVIDIPYKENMRLELRPAYSVNAKELANNAFNAISSTAMDNCTINEVYSNCIRADGRSDDLPGGDMLTTNNQVQRGVADGRSYYMFAHMSNMCKVGYGDNLTENIDYRCKWTAIWTHTRVGQLCKLSYRTYKSEYWSPQHRVFRATGKDGAKEGDMHSWDDMWKICTESRLDVFTEKPLLWWEVAPY